MGTLPFHHLDTQSYPDIMLELRFYLQHMQRNEIWIAIRSLTSRIKARILRSIYQQVISFSSTLQYSSSRNKYYKQGMQVTGSLLDGDLGITKTHS